MQKVYTCDNIMFAGLVKGQLEANGIHCLLKNESLAGGIGELPPIECWPEVWITDDTDLPEARRIIDSMQRDLATVNKPWRCQCGEIIEGQFTQCWNCGSELPD